MGTSGSGTVATSACSRKGCDGSRNFCAPCEMTTQHLASNLEDKLKAVPTRPGVYLMKDAAGRVIYVGKAASLRNRVRQYFQDSGHLESPRIRHLMSKIADFEVVACENEVEALILETNLIKQHRPPYNVRMADDKAFPYVKLTNEPYPKIRMTRKVLRDGASYFGPYPYHEPKLVTRTIRTIRKLFKLRSCNIEITRDLPRPCLDYYIGLCTAPCVAWVQMFYIRAGRLQGQEHFLLEGTRGLTRAEALGGFLTQYYQEAPSVPREVILQDSVEDGALIAEWLTQKRGSKVEVVVPQRGERKRLADMAGENAALFLNQERARVSGLDGAGIKELQEILGLEHAPFRIEAYDVSNFQAGETVGSLVVFEGARPLKRDYRRFKMKWTEGPNDYASLQEMLRRRFAMAREEQEQLDRDEPVPVKWSVMPDLILIDGGRGQLNAARDVLFEYNVPIPAIGLAKREELIVTADSVDPIALPRDSHALRLLQRVRDEAHRFANAYHQKLRERRIVFSVLDEIKGIGEKRKRELIRRFGSVRHVREAPADQIAEVVGPKMAQKVLEYLRDHPDVRYKDEAVR